MKSVSATEFIALLEAGSEGDGAGQYIAALPAEKRNWRIPTGPWDPVDVCDPLDSTLEVRDNVDLRGLKIHSVYWYGVRFRGRVDMRDLTIEGSVDLTGCVFEDELRLDDAEVESSLRLKRISVKKLSMNGIIVNGRLDLVGCRAQQATHLFDATVDGFIDLRGVDAPEVMLKGAHLRGDLRAGCGPEGRVQQSVASVDAAGCRIGGRVVVVGSGTGQVTKAEASSSADRFGWPSGGKRITGPELRFSNAEVAGDFLVAPWFGGVDKRATYYDWVQYRLAGSSPNVVGRLS